MQHYIDKIKTELTALFDELNLIELLFQFHFHFTSFELWNDFELDDGPEVLLEQLNIKGDLTVIDIGIDDGQFEMSRHLCFDKHHAYLCVMSHECWAGYKFEVNTCPLSTTERLINF